MNKDSLWGCRGKAAPLSLYWKVFSHFVYKFLIDFLYKRKYNKKQHVDKKDI